METRRQPQVSPVWQPAAASRPPPIPDLRTPSAFQPGFIREFETLRLQTRSLQSQNQILTAELQKLRAQAAKGESRFIEQITLEEQLMLQFQKEKNYQIDLMRLKNEEELSKLRRDKDREIEAILKDLRGRENQLRDRADKAAALEKRNSELSRAMAVLEKELLQAKDATAQLHDQLVKATAAEKAVTAKLNQLNVEKEEMKREIHLLLQIDAQKSQTMSVLEMRAANSQSNQKVLNDKIMLLSEGLLKLQQSHRIMKDRLQTQQNSLSEMDGLVERMRNQLSIKDAQLKSLSENLLSQKIQSEQSSRKEKIRQKEVLELMATNQRLFSQNANIRHRLHDLAITYGFLI